MRICPNCKYTHEEDINFCPQCGTAMVAPEPVAVAVAEEKAPEVPVIPSEPTFTAPEVPTIPVQKPHLALKIVSMALSAFGLLLAAYGSLYTLIGLMEDGVAFVFALVFAMFCVPASIVGLCLSAKCRAAGDTSIFSRLGKLLGIIGIIVAGSNLLLGLLSIVSY